MEETKKKSRGIYWLLFFVSLIAFVAFLIFQPEWFWVTLPFVATSLASAMDAI
jgi:hypothetical protein